MKIKKGSDVLSLQGKTYSQTELQEIAKQFQDLMTEIKTASLGDKQIKQSPKEEAKMKEYCIYCGKERTVKIETGFYDRHTGNPTYDLVCPNKKCTKKFRLEKLLKRGNRYLN